MAARSHGRGAGWRPRAEKVCWPGVGFGRRSLDGGSGDRRGCAGAAADSGSVRALQFARRGRVCRQNALCDALQVGRTRGEEAMSAASRSDALAFFGATGDLAYKKIFPALHAMARRGHLEFPVIGVAKSGWNLDQLRGRARESIEKHGGGGNDDAFKRLIAHLRYIDGDYQDPATYTALLKAMDGAKYPAHYLAIPPSL